MSERREYACFETKWVNIPKISEETKKAMEEMRRDPTNATYYKLLESFGIISRESYETKNKEKDNERT